jgi:hypothetical protein
MAKRTSEMEKNALSESDCTSKMDKWPHEWEGFPADVPVGERLVEEMRPLIYALIQKGLAKKTVRNHMSNLWLIGGEIIRDVNDTPRRRRLSARKLVLDAIAEGEAPLVSGLSETDQCSVDSTARKLFKFLTNS